MKKKKGDWPYTVLNHQSVVVYVCIDRNNIRAMQSPVLKKALLTDNPAIYKLSAYTFAYP